MTSACRPWSGILIIATLAAVAELCGGSGNEGAILTSVADTWPDDIVSSWLDTSDPCESAWKHVTCADGVVTGLIVNNLNISGTLSPDIGQLVDLRTLDLSNNRFSGPLPSTIVSLKQLVVLNLANNSFTGAIPAGLAGISTLTTIGLAHNNFSGELPEAFLKSSASCQQFGSNPRLCSAPCVNLQPCNATAGHNLSFFPPPPPPPPPSPPPAPPSGGKSSSSSSIGPVIGGVAGGILAAVAIGAIAFWCHRKKRREYARRDALEHDVEVGQFGQLERFKLAEMERATNNFSQTGELGQGGFGQVFKGTLDDGRAVAIKRLRKDRKRAGDEAFLRELETISRAVHRSVVRVVGFCIERGERMLVFPFMPHGSVLDHLHGKRPAGRAGLPWETRMRIAVETAQGLAYMHHDCSPKLIHCDVKAANVLLDEGYNAVVADFGLTRLANVDNAVPGGGVTAVRGTIGHIAPEYMERGVVSEKTDVFAFGVFVLELVSGKPAFDLTKAPEEENLFLREWVVKLLTQGQLAQLIDPELPEDPTLDMNQVVLCLQVAAFCLLPDPERRPVMSECLTLLQGHELADRWEQWREEMADLGYAPVPQAANWAAADLSLNMEAFELSGPR